ncbi:class I adenylate-forming enzyme family protein [Cumulibacter soli]|uniref:class I adenylate-forming enzyme family protein n=1 Tax=Cumulibacter soli TaxID=2546344 RepID=UPI00141A3618|nr:AMP-binding protein [Cumulibacter soli]
MDNPLRTALALTGTEVDAEGIRHFTDIPPTLLAFLRDAAADSGDKTALVGPDESVHTFASLYQAAREVAGGLRDRGVVHGDRVVLYLGNGLPWIESFFGILLAGAIAVPVNPKLTERELAYIVENCTAVLTLRAGSDVPRGSGYYDEEVAAGDVAAICYTSGTTGFPKGAVLTHTNLLSSTEAFSRALEIDDSVPTGFVSLVAMPLFHAAGLVTQLLTTFRSRGSCVIRTGFDASDYLACIEKYRVNSLLAVPTIHFAVLAHPDFESTDRSSVRTVLYGSTPVPTTLPPALAAGYPGARLGNGYGMTEYGNATYLPDADAVAHPASVGYLNVCTDIRIEAPEGQVGELLVRGPHVSRRYWASEGATDSFDGPWLRTGDMVRMDEDGRLYVVDRVKDMIIRGGENIYSSEVENAIMQHEAVAEVAVVGYPDERLGERVRAVVVLKPAFDVDADSLLQFLASGLAKFKLPERVDFRSEPLPRNTTGKLLKRELRQHGDEGRE